MTEFRQRLKETSLGRKIRLQRLRRRRHQFALSYFQPALNNVRKWVTDSREVDNFTYEIEPTNRRYLAHLLSTITGKPSTAILGYFEELEKDDELRAHILRETEQSPHKLEADPAVHYGRRIGWYAVVRATKPKVVIETGIDKGLGSCVLARALMENEREGHPGYYYGTDINPHAGYLFSGPYAEYGKVLYGDSLESLKQFTQPIDIFINDSDHSAEYEVREYETIREKLSPHAVVLGDNAHVTDKLCLFAEATNRQFLFFAEKPQDHWYPGAGIGFAFNPGQLRSSQ